MLETDIQYQGSQDTAWKDVLDVMLTDFLELCYPDLFNAIDWHIPYQPLDKELHAVFKDNEIGHRYVDKLVKVMLKTGHQRWLLVHVEVEGRPNELLAERMFVYAYRLYDRYRKPIFSCVILTDDKPNYRPDAFNVGFGVSQLSFNYGVIKLLDYQDRLEELETADNPFASVILTQLKALSVKKHSAEQQKAMKFALTKRLYTKKYPKETIKKLFLFLDWLIALPKELENSYLDEVIQLNEESKMPYIHSAERRGMERGMEQGLLQGLQQGIEQGFHNGEASVLKMQLRQKFGALNQEIQTLIDNADSNQLLEWASKILIATTIEQVFEN
jgi:hypothetical protein